MADHSESDTSPLVPPLPPVDPSSIDLEAGPSEQIQCRICLETDGNFNFNIFPFQLLISICLIFFLSFHEVLENLNCDVEACFFIS